MLMVYLHSNRNMRTKIRCQSSGTRRTLRQAVVDTHRSVAIQTTAKTIQKDVVVIGNLFSTWSNRFLAWQCRDIVHTVHFIFTKLTHFVY